MSFFLAISLKTGVFVNPFRHQTATAAQKHDLLNSHHLGPVECFKCSQSLVSCDSIIDDIYMHLQFL